MVERVLASDAEREACAVRLRDAAAEGRLDVLELDQRLGAAYGARTRADLARLTADLPELPQVAEPRPGWHWRTPGGHRRRIVACAAAANAWLMGLWMADVGAMRDPVILGIDGFELPWPLIPLLAWASVSAAVTWRRRRAEQPTPKLSRAIG